MSTDDNSASKDKASEPSSKSISTNFLAGIQGQTPEAWQRLVDLYGPMVYHWCRQSNLHAEDAADVVQEVFAAAARAVADFHRDQPGDSFSAWLRTITRNKIRDYFRRLQGKAQAMGGTQAQQRIMEIPEPPDPDELPTQTEQADDNSLLSHRALELVRAEFEDKTWQAFWLVAVDERSPADVADDLGMTLHAVYKAKSRVLIRLRQELDEFPK